MIKDIKKRALHRSRILEGQFKALEKAIDGEEYCVDVLIQSLSIQKSLRSLDKLILENHMKTHVKEGMSTASAGDKDKLIEELLQLYELTNVRR